MTAAVGTSAFLGYPGTCLGIVCPMANEAPTAIAFIRDVLQQVAAFEFKKATLFVVLDHASQDQTRHLLESALDIPELRIIWAPENRNIVDAYVRGYRAALAAGSDWILEIDAGYSHRPMDIPLFFDAMSKGRDCVFGSRFCVGGSMQATAWSRYVISFGGTQLVNLLLGTKVQDMTSGFELFSREALTYLVERQGIHSKGPFFQTELKVYCRFLNWTEVPITYVAASHAVGWKAIVDAMQNLARLTKMRLLRSL